MPHYSGLVAATDTETAGFKPIAGQLDRVKL